MLFKSKTQMWQVVALLTTAFFIICNYLTGVLVQPNDDMLYVQIRDIGAAMALPAIGGYGFFALPVIISKARRAVLHSAALTGSRLDVANQYASKISQIPRGYIYLSAGLGTLIMISYFVTENLFYVEELGLSGNLIRFPLALQAVFMWTSITLGILVIYRITRLVTEFVELHLQVEVFTTEEVFPIANTLFWNVLFFSLGVSLVPLFGLGEFPTLKDSLLIMTVLIILFNLMFYPLLRVRQLIIEKKATAFQQHRFQLMNGHLAIHQRPEQSATQQSVTSTDYLYLDMLQGHRSARDWPINLQLMLRFLCVLTVPLVGWIILWCLRWLL